MRVHLRLYVDIPSPIFPLSPGMLAASLTITERRLPGMPECRKCSSEEAFLSNQRTRTPDMAVTRIIVTKVKAVIRVISVIQRMRSTNPLVAVIAGEGKSKGLIPLDELLVQRHPVHELAATRVTYEVKWPVQGKVDLFGGKIIVPVQISQDNHE